MCVQIMRQKQRTDPWQGALVSWEHIYWSEVTGVQGCDDAPPTGATVLADAVRKTYLESYGFFPVNPAPTERLDKAQFLAFCDLAERPENAVGSLPQGYVALYKRQGFSGTAKSYEVTFAHK